ncbi:hypothetical protein [Methylorubrum populi]|uniref:Uncharacterized protein n=1 Tax=Methylorubrum populi TaxID=223967 RepID=A0A833JAZ7_9HYPH|nr:hypothetical protein [Methylorubrum populi]KAB7788079.1 hypothetical protein F8B43_0084 [Methylorubrum populi]
MSALENAVAALDAYWASRALPTHEAVERIHWALDEVLDSAGPFEPSEWRSLLHDALLNEGYAVTFRGDEIATIVAPC